MHKTDLTIHEEHYTCYKYSTLNVHAFWLLDNFDFKGFKYFLCCYKFVSKQNTDRILKIYLWEYYSVDKIDTSHNIFKFVNVRLMWHWNEI